MNGSKVLLMGLAYKENVDDMRESPTFELFDLLDSQGAIIEYYDPHVPEIIPTREHAKWTGQKSAKWSAEEIASYDAVIICTNHKIFDLEMLVDNADLIVDTRNAMREIEGKTGQIRKA